MKQIIKNIIISLITLEARFVLWRHHPRVVAVAGSVGKTSTKDAIAAVLAKTYSVQKSKKSYNSETGVPLAILGEGSGWNSPIAWAGILLRGIAVIIRGEYPDWVVLEVGVDRPGDMDRLASWLTVDMLVFTCLPKIPVHVEYFTRPEDVAEEKLKLIQALVPGGSFIYNADDEKLREFVQQKRFASMVSYGVEQSADISGSAVKILYRGRGKTRKVYGIEFTATYHDQKQVIELPGVLGEHSAQAYLAALACGAIAGMPLKDMAIALEGHEREPGRMKILDGNRGSVIIDDSYNSSPVALAAAIRTVFALKVPGKRIAVIGDMAELGKFSDRQHHKAGQAIARVFDRLITVGKKARLVAEGALEEGMNESHILQYDDARRAGKELDTLLEEGDVVLIKGSQSMRLERVTEEIMAEPEKKRQLLPRQDDAWMSR